MNEQVAIRGITHTFAQAYRGEIPESANRIKLANASNTKYMHAWPSEEVSVPENRSKGSFAKGGSSICAYLVALAEMGD